MIQPVCYAREVFADVRAAQGLAPVDLLLKNCRLVNVFSQEVHPADIAIRGSKIVAVRSKFEGPAAKTLHCGNRYAIPGFVQLDRSSASGSHPCASTWIVDSSAPVSASGSTHAGHSRRLLATHIRQHLANLCICSTLEDAVAAIRSGATVFLAPGSYRVLVEMRRKGIDTSRICLSIPERDDVSLFVHAFFENSFPPARIFQMLSLNPARHFALDHEIGSISPARKADILLATSLDPFELATVIFDGQLILHEGRTCV